MTAFPVSDFVRDVGIDYSRDSASSNARAKSRPDEARSNAGSEDAREDDVFGFDKALRDQDVNEPARSSAERAPERINERPKEVATSQTTPTEAPTVMSGALAESKSAAKSDAARGKLPGEQPEAQVAARTALILPEVVQVISATAPNSTVINPETSGEAGAEAKAEGAGAPLADCAILPVVIPPNIVAQTEAQNLLAALAAGVPAPLETPRHVAAPQDENAVAPAADPLVMPKDARAGLKADAPGQGPAQQNNGQSPAAQSVAVTPANGSFEAAAAVNAAPALKLRQVSDPESKSADAPLQDAAPAPAIAPQSAARSVSATQSAVKAAAAQGPKDAKAADAPIADMKASSLAQASAFAAQIDTQSAHSPAHASAAASGQASANSVAIAHNVVRFYRETGSGSARFDIRLDPVELGRVDARVEINHDKTVTLTLSAERPETLAELMRTARDLERQLTDSGVKLSDDGLKFRLNSDARGDAQQNMQSGYEGRRPARGVYDAGADATLQAETAIPIRSWRASGVDVWA